MPALTSIPRICDRLFDVEIRTVICTTDEIVKACAERFLGGVPGVLVACVARSRWQGWP
jgi:hypothetical protein